MTNSAGAASRRAPACGALPFWPAVRTKPTGHPVRAQRRILVLRSASRASDGLILSPFVHRWRAGERGHRGSGTRNLGHPTWLRRHAAKTLLRPWLLSDAITWVFPPKGYAYRSLIPRRWGSKTNGCSVPAPIASDFVQAVFSG